MAEPANIDQRLQELLEISAAQAKRIRAWESARAQDGGLCDWHRLISEHLHRLEAACLPSNMASRRLLGKCGFREEGYARKYLCINGVWQDHVLFGQLAEEWRLSR